MLLNVVWMWRAKTPGPPLLVEPPTRNTHTVQVLRNSRFQARLHYEYFILELNEAWSVKNSGRAASRSTFAQLFVFTTEVMPFVSRKSFAWCVWCLLLMLLVSGHKKRRTFINCGRKWTDTIWMWNYVEHLLADIYHRHHRHRSHLMRLTLAISTVMAAIIWQGEWMYWFEVEHPSSGHLASWTWSASWANVWERPD